MSCVLYTRTAVVQESRCKRRMWSSRRRAHPLCVRGVFATAVLWYLVPGMPKPHATYTLLILLHDVAFLVAIAALNS